MKMKLPPNVNSFNPAGFELAVVDGVVDVPQDHIATAHAHGLKQYVEQELTEFKKGVRVVLTLEDESTVHGTIKKVAGDLLVVTGDDGEEYASPREFVAAEE